MYYFIMNPTASSGMGRKVWKKLKPILKMYGAEYSINTFKKEEELVGFVRTLTSHMKTDYPVSGMTEEEDDLQSRFDTGKMDNEKDLQSRFDTDKMDGDKDVDKDAGVHIVVLGGDGTLNLVLNSIVDIGNTKLSCIRVGSGNDFARNAGVDKDPEKALIHLLEDPVKVELDYGEACYVMTDGTRKKRRFIISSGIGYDADICEEVSHSELKKFLNAVHLGKLVYVMIGIKQIFTRRNTKVKIYLDDNAPIRAGNLFFAVGMIHEMEGGGVPFCPHADPCDGLLEVCVAKGAPIPKLLLEVVMVYLKKHLIFSNIEEYRCRKMRIITEKPQWIHMDGETPCRIKAAELVCRQGLHFIK